MTPYWNWAHKGGLRFIGPQQHPGYTDQMLGQMTEKMEKFMECRLRYLFSAFTAIRTFCGSTGKKIPQNLGEWEDVCDYFVKQGITPVIANNDISLKTLAIGQSFYSHTGKTARRKCSGN